MKVFHERIVRHQLRDALWYWLYIPTAVIGSGILVDRAAGLSHFGRHAATWVLAALLIVSGLTFIFSSMRDLEVLGQGTPSPKAPPRRLVTGHSYSLCRHPMFLGYDMAALGVLLLIGSPGGLFVAYPVMMLLEWRFLKREERKLERRFGEDYLRYRNRTPFLIPFIKGPVTKASGSRDGTKEPR